MSEEDKEVVKEEEKCKCELLREAYNAFGFIAKIEKAFEVLDKEIIIFDFEFFNVGVDVFKVLEI